MPSNKKPATRGRRTFAGLCNVWEIEADCGKTGCLPVQPDDRPIINRKEHKEHKELPIVNHYPNPNHDPNPNPFSAIFALSAVIYI